MLVLVADTQMIGAGSREGGGCRAWAGVVVYGRGLSCMEGGCRAWKGAARARGARGASLSERVQESRNGTLKG